MTTNNSINSIFSNESDGFILGGGTTARTLTLDGSNIIISGSANVTLSAQAQSGFIALQDGSVLTNGSIPFANSTGLLTQDNSSLFWDNTNKRLGVGTSSPVADINVAKSTANGSVNVRIDNSSNNSGSQSIVQLLNDLDDGPQMISYSSTRTGTIGGTTRANAGVILFNGGANSFISSNDVADLIFALNDVEQLRLKSVESTFEMTAVRLETGKGSDVASADEMTLSIGNYFAVTGTTTINHITNTDWILGSIITLKFDASVTVTHNAASPTGTEASILLNGDVDLSATAGDTLMLVLDSSTEWIEIPRR